MTDHEQEHDQLPSVESYKANMRVNGIYVAPPVNAAAAAAVTPAFLDEDHPYGTNVEEFPSHDLPNVEEYKAGHTGAGSSVWWKSTTCLMVTALFLVSLIVGIAVPLQQQQDDSNWWLFHRSARYEDIQTFVVQNRISTLSDLQDESSPQHKAAKWLANKDGMRMTIPPPLKATSSTAFIERYVLAVFYFATGGPNWNQSLNFLSSEHVCTWYGILPMTTDGTTTTTNVKDEGDYLTLGIHACKLVEEELVPLVLFLRK